MTQPTRKKSGTTPKTSNTTKTHHTKKDIADMLDVFYGMKLDEKQKEFRDAIWSTDYDIIFCNAKSGTGKTTLAIGMANLLIKSGEYTKLIYVVSPTQETKQGFLPGSLEEKTAVYFDPVIQALEEIGEDPQQAIVQFNPDDKLGRAWISCVPHTFMRGVNFKGSDGKGVIVIIDEMQNMYLEDAKKVLTRCHDSAKTICIGHEGQNDLYKNPRNSGFVPYINHFKDQPRAKVCELTTNYRGWVSTHADNLLIGKDK